MSSATLIKMGLIDKIAKLPEQKIYEVDRIIQNMLLELKLEKVKPISLNGIWKNKGFEKIADIEAEIEKNR